MKKGTTKIILLVLSLALLVGAAIGISVSANTTAPDIISKNVKTSGNFCLQFAVDPATVIGDDVTLTIYNQDPTGLEGDALTEATVQTITKAKTDTELVALDGDKVQDDEVIVFDTKGVSAKDIADVWYIKTASGGAESALETYSVREYAFERLYKDGTIFAAETDDDDYKYRQQQFYLTLLEMGSVAQELQVNYKLEAAGSEPEKLAKEYIYAYVDGGTYTVGEGEATDRGFVQNGDVLTLTATDSATTGWNVYTYLQGDTLDTTQVVALGDTVTVTGNTVILPYVAGVTPGLYFEEIGDPVYNFNSMSYLNFVGESGEDYLSKTGYNTSGSFFYRFEDSGYPKYGKALALYKTETAGSQSLIHFPIAAAKSENANCVVFEYDYLYTGMDLYYSSATTEGAITSNGTFFFSMNSGTIQNVSGNSWTALKNNGYKFIEFQINTYDLDGVTAIPDGGTQYKSEKGTNSMRLPGSTKDLEANTWYNICLEIYTDAKIWIIYVDGVQVSTGNISVTNAISDYNSISFMMDYRIRNYDMLYDNICGARIVKECPIK